MCFFKKRSGDFLEGGWAEGWGRRREWGWTGSWWDILRAPDPRTTAEIKHLQPAAPLACPRGRLTACPLGACHSYKRSAGRDCELNFYVWYELALSQTRNDARLVHCLTQPPIPGNFHFNSSLRRAWERKSFWLGYLCLLFMAVVQNGLIKKERKLISSFLSSWELHVLCKVENRGECCK